MSYQSTECCPVPAQSIKELTQFLLHGSNTLTESERALIARVASNGNIQTPVSEKMKALLNIAAAVRDGRKRLMPELTELATQAGATEIEIHDTVLMAVLLA